METDSLYLTLEHRFIEIKDNPLYTAITGKYIFMVKKLDLSFWHYKGEPFYINLKKSKINVWVYDKHTNTNRKQMSMLSADIFGIAC